MANYSDAHGEFKHVGAYQMFRVWVSVYIFVLDLFFFFKQKTAYEMQRGLVGSEMCIRDRSSPVWGFLPFLAFLSEALNVPNPTSVTLSSFSRALVIAEKT
eukprot:TRINITY_DN53183_c0_g1_i1.p2 TRINITY_DN53183_c0_g1~~TRINITY_DN53183_c0_g1_i1.p2  ORF type:complete len:101 (-),score=20.54 TRINITY_DN53183_c0_g1_i1:328-630(-)